MPNLGDITAINWSYVEIPHIVTAGFPCQPHSTAGLRLGSSDDRNLWPEVVRCLRVLRPRYLVAENVPGILTSDGGRMFGSILADLAELGYDAEWSVLSACAVGAPHTRDRVWIIAYPERDEQPREESRYGADRRVGRLQQPFPWHRDWEDALREFRGVDDGLSYGVDRLDGLRNAIVPQVAVQVFGRILALDTTSR